METKRRDLVAINDPRFANPVGPHQRALCIYGLSAEIE